MIELGKWEVKRGNSGMLSVYSDSPDLEGSVCACGCDFDPKNKELAALIAALPDLLAACTNAINCIDFSDCPHTKIMLTEAIAKAENN